jgi:rhodanese-related sulfurtransferase
MIKAAVTRLAPLPFVVVLACGPRPEAEAVRNPATPGAATPPARQAVAPASPTPKPGRVTRIMLGDLFQLQQENRALIFDVRPAFVYRLGHIPGAVNWPKASFKSQLAVHEPEIAAARAAGKPVVLYCVDLACPDARIVSSWLAERGHSVTILEGGWDAWKTGGLPAE